jgi:hypothetical protein
MKTKLFIHPVFSVSFFLLTVLITPTNSIGFYLWKTPHVVFMLVALVLAFCLGIWVGNQQPSTTTIIDKRLRLGDYASLFRN